MKRYLLGFFLLSNFLSAYSDTETKLIEEKKIVIVIPSYNNADVVRKNLNSVFAQDYCNYQVIYVDDISSDGTADMVEQYMIEHNIPKEKLTLIRNTKRSLAMANLYRAIMLCDDSDIVATLDGDDWFEHDQVLNRLNEAYADPNVWLTYGSYTDWPEPEPEVLQHWIENLGGTLGNRPVPQEVIDTNDFRNFIGCTGQLRTFYAWLFKQIKLEDLMYKSEFLPMTYDVGIMIPMHELAGGRFKYIDEILYVHNLDTEFNDHKVDAKLQGDLEILLRGKKAYEPLDSSREGYFDRFTESKADIVVFSYDRPLQLYAYLESVQKYVTGVNTIVVVYRASDESFETAYEQVRKDFADVVFLPQDSAQQKKDFKTLTLQAMNIGQAEHILFAVDDIIMTDYVDLNECITWLEQTDAHAFFLRLGSNLNYCYSNNAVQAVPPFANLDTQNNIFAWQFAYAQHDWAYPNNVDMTLYRKAELLPFFESFNFTSPNFLEGYWATKRPSRSVGLCYAKTKMVNLPINTVTEDAFNNNMNAYSAQEFLKMFEQGFKIDIEDLYQFESVSAHTEYVPNFVTR